ncbi:MAG: WD40-like repeat-like protein [Verrucomicrobiales bacterium]|nr:WD40-like repeat-like protein [Verrucomicrobiales bacterium]
MKDTDDEVRGWWRRGWFLRISTIVAPPLGLVLVWIDRKRSIWRKVLGTVGIACYCIIYWAVAVTLLYRSGSKHVEWPGGYLPRIVLVPTLPDYERVEADRAQPKLTSKPITHSSRSYWTGYRGPNRDGVYSETAISTNWPTGGMKEVWRKPIGGGYGSFAIADGLAFTIEQRREFEVASAYDVQTGAEVWTNAWKGFFQESMGGDGPRATPTYSAGKIYAQGAEGELRCIQADSGTTVWSKNILQDNGAWNSFYGIAPSPLIVDNLVIVPPGGPRNRAVVAYNRDNGSFVWGSQNDEAAYSSPMIANLGGVRQILVVMQSRALGLVPETGALLWEHPWIVLHGNRNIAQPLLISTNRLFLSAGYGTGCELVEISNQAGKLAAQSIWKNRNMKNKFTSSVLADGFIYGLDEDILTCLDAVTGERKWKGGRYGYGQIVLAAPRDLIILGGQGELALVEINPTEPHELNRFRALPGKTWNHPAISSGYLLIRNAVEMVCYDLKAQ